MSAAHCFEGVDRWAATRYFYVGTHKKLDPVTGQKIPRASVEGIDKNFNPVKFPVNEAIHSWTFNLIDVAIITLVKDIVFGGAIKKVRLESPKAVSDNCLKCSGDCDPSNIFKVYGWGFYSQGIKKMFILTYSKI